MEKVSTALPHLTSYQKAPFVGNLLQLHLEQDPHSPVRERRNVFTAFCNTFNYERVCYLTAPRVKAWFMEMQEQNEYCERNLNAIKSLLNHFFKFLVTERYLKENPLDKIRFPRRCPPTRQRVILSRLEIISMLETLKTQSPTIIYPFIFTLTHTGARRDEIRCLKWNDVDFANSLIHLRFTKNGKARSIKMDTVLRELLQSLPKISERVFMNQFGRPLSATQVDDALIRLQKKFPTMKRWRCHDLRHSFAYNYLKQGGDMYRLQAILGHRSIDVTIDLYGQLQAIDVDELNLYRTQK